MEHGHPPFIGGGIYPGSGVVDAVDEQRLYLTGQGQSHGWYVDSNWQELPRWKAAMKPRGDISLTGFARWPQWRLFGYRADPEGLLTLTLPPRIAPCELRLNCETTPDGAIRVELPDRDGYRLADAVPLTGNHLNAAVAWKQGTAIQPTEHSLVIRLHLECATVWAYALHSC